MCDVIRLDSTDILILIRNDSEDNFHYLEGSCVAFFDVVSRTEDTKLIAELFEGLLASFKMRPTELGLATPNLLFVFLGMFAQCKQTYNQSKAKILYCLKESNSDKSIVEWFESGGAEECYAMSEDEWFLIIIKVISSDDRTCDEINDLLEKGSNEPFDRISLRVKGILEGYLGDDNLTSVIRRVMKRLQII